MTKPYLPSWATAQEAAEWLQAETGEPWPLPRLLEQGPMPSVWLEPDERLPAAVMSAVFNGRHEGFLAPVVFVSDTHRMSVVRSGALSMTRTPAGALVRFQPPIAFGVDELRFAAEDVRRCAAPAAEPARPAAATKPARGTGGSNAELFALARTLAEESIARWAASGLFPPQPAIADEVAAELRKRGEFGADGKPLTGATIKRHALRGISSATKKAQSTTRKRGK